MGIVTVVGIGADGWDGMDARARALINEADVVVGGARHLAMLPQSSRQRIPWPSPLRDQLAEFIAAQTGRVVALASGDPLVSGIGTTLIDVLGADRVEMIPAVSSVTLARARMKWSAESCEVISMVGRDPHTVLRSLSPGHRLLVLSGDSSTPGAVARLLDEVGYGASQLTVLEDLGGAEETRSEGTSADWDGAPSALNIVAIECIGENRYGRAAGLPDEAFSSGGQVTKRDIRASALARLLPMPGQLLWDVGAGAGSIGIEWMLAHPTCRAVAIEARPDRVMAIRANCTRLGVPALHVIEGLAPHVLEGLPQPDAVFVGGGASVPGVLESCWERLNTGGRFVVHGVTLETEILLLDWYARHGGELSRLHVEHAGPLGGFTGWTPTRTVTQFALTKGPR